MGARDRSPVGEDRPGGCPPGLEELLQAVGKGDRGAFERLYEVLAPRVYGLVLRVLRDRAHSEEVTQEVLVEVWRSAARYEPDKGSAPAWVLTIAHRRAIDRVCSAQAGTEREERAARLEPHPPRPARRPPTAVPWCCPARPIPPGRFLRGSDSTCRGSARSPRPMTPSTGSTPR